MELWVLFPTSIHTTLPNINPPPPQKNKSKEPRKERKEEVNKENNTVGKSKLTASFVNASTGQPIELLVQGNWFNRSATITIKDTEIVAAQVSRQFMNARQLLGGMQTVSSFFLLTKFRKYMVESMGRGGRRELRLKRGLIRE